MEPRRGEGCTLGEMASRVKFALLAAAAAALLAAVPAVAKQGVRATLNGTVPLDASPGTHVRVAWTLTYVDEHGRKRPFGAGAVYVRLLSSTGAGAQTAYAAPGAHEEGRYTASVVVPEGGIRDIQIALHGFTSGANGTRNADVRFPITNDPLPGVAPVKTRATAGDGARWIAGAVIGAALFAAALLAASAVRRRTPGAIARG